MDDPDGVRAKKMPPPLKKSPPPLGRTKQALPTPSPGLMSTCSNQLQALSHVPVAVQNFLMIEGLNAKAFSWIVPVDSIQMRSGDQSHDGIWLAQLFGSESVCVFRYASSTGFQMARGTPSSRHVSMDTRSGTMALVLALSSDSPVASCRIVVNKITCERAQGPWLDFWEGDLRETFSLSEDEPVAVVQWETFSPKLNEFGTQSEMHADPIWVILRRDHIETVPDVGRPALSESGKWYISGSSVEYGHAKVASRFTVLQTMGGSVFVDSLTVKLHPSARSTTSPTARMASAALFIVAGKNEQILLLKNPQGGFSPEENWEHPYCYSSHLGDRGIVLATAKGESILLSLPPGAEAPLMAATTELNSPVCLPGSSDLWIVAAHADESKGAIRILLGQDSVTFGDDAPIPLHRFKDLRVDPAAPGFLSVTFTDQDGGDAASQTIVTTEQIGYAFWAEWDSRKTILGLAKVPLADLYRQFNRAKCHNHLLVLFGELLLLNRMLDADLPMGRLVRDLGASDVVSFGEDKALRDATIRKMLLLASTLPSIRQRYEVIATMSPYYWVQTEMDWLQAAFGSALANRMAKAERQRIVPRVRRQVRAVQSDLFRALGQVEAAIKPVEALFAREEVQKHWSSRVRRYAPIAVQIGIGATAFFSGGSSLLVANLLGGAIVTHGLGSILGHFQNDREASAQIMRAAQTVFPWWQTFMQTLVVSIFESAEFVADENAAAEKRDRDIFGRAPEVQRPTIRSRMEAQLRRRIVEERRARFNEALDGSGVRLLELVRDLHDAIGPAMRDSVSCFMNELVVTGRRRKHGEAPNAADSI